MTQPGPEVQHLGALVGRWRTDGHIIADPPVPIAGSDTYEWLPGGFFLVHHVDVLVGEHAVQALEMIGDYDRTTDSFTARAYDSRGNITILHAKVDDRGAWRFTGGGDIATEAQPDAKETAAVRSTPTVHAERNSMKAFWERSADGSAWELWMDVSFTRMAEPDD
jgi:hypothetical protein